MVVEQQGFIAAAFALGKHHRRAAGGHDLDCEAALCEHFAHQGGAFLQAPVLRPNAGLGAQPGELGDAVIQMFFEIGIDLRDNLSRFNSP